MLANPGSMALLPWVKLPLWKFGRGDSSDPLEVALAALRFGGTG